MNKYTCLDCGAISVKPSVAPEVSSRCACGVEPTKHRLGEHKVEKAKAQGTVEQPKVKAEPAKKPNPPVITNQSASGVKI